MGSVAVGLDRVSRIVGYNILKGNFQNDSPNLPQRIAVLAEANHANQSTLLLTPQEITSARQAGDLFGYGSPIHIKMRILRPFSGDGVGGIKTIVYPQAEAVGATAKIMTITPVGVSTGNGTHLIEIAGRESIDGVSYAVNIAKGDTVAIIAGKIANAINAVLNSPVTATSDTYSVTLTSKWRGLTAQEIGVEVEVGDNALGLSYVVNQTQAGAGTPSIAGALAQFGNVWNTIVDHGYTDASILDALEQFNGIPLQSNPTGRYAGLTWKPFIALFGSILDDPTTITDARLAQVTNALCPAPGSEGLSMEAASNMCVLYAFQAQNNPHLDVSGQSYPDMPTPDSIGSMADYNNRDAFVKKGASTVDLVAGQYQVQDFVTTYHPLGEVPPQYRYCRNLNLDMNVRYGYYLLELVNVIDHAIAKNEDQVSADNVIKPKQWIQVLNDYADDLASRALVVDSPFMQKSITVTIGISNPDRFETFFRYKRSGYARIASTSAEAGFNFGTLN